MLVNVRHENVVPTLNKIFGNQMHYYHVMEVNYHVVNIKCPFLTACSHVKYMGVN